jgi:peptide/nickel transport system substrate-binding protein
MTRPDDLNTRLAKHRIGRRDFVKGTAALGLAAAIPAVASTKEARASSTPKRGGRLRQGLLGGATSDTLEGATLLDTHVISTSWQVRSNLTEVLPDGNVAGELAETWEPSSDAKKWVFKLRKGVEFHNGKTLDADDVVHSINAHRGPDSKSAALSIVQDIEDVKADGKDTVVFTLKNGSADFPFVLADRHLVIAIAGTKGPEWDKGIGTGPFILTEWEPGIRSASKRNPNYFKEGKPYFDEVETLNILDVAARTSALQTGEVDVIDEADIKTLDRLESSGGIVVREAPGTKHFTYPMFSNTAPFDNNDVRLALKYAIDREAMLQTILRGHGYLGNDHPIGENQRFFASDLPQRQYDPDKAKYHLKQAGLSNLSVELHAADIYTGCVDGAVLYQERAAKAGINIEVKRQPSDGFWANFWMKRPFVAVWWGGRPTEDWMFSLAYQTGSSWNDSLWSHERFDKLLLEARAELDFNKRHEMYAEMQGIVRDEGSVVIPVFTNWVGATSDKVATPDRIGGNWSIDGARNHERWWFA